MVPGLLPDGVPDLLGPLIETGRPWLASYGLLAVGIGLFTETLLFTGVFVPGFGILVAAGYLCHTRVLPTHLVLPVAWFGALLGDQCSFLLGWWCGEKVLPPRRRPFARRLRRALEQGAPALLLWYHYAPPLRAIVPCAAGIAHCGLRRWLILDAPGIVLWVVVAWLLGYCAHSTMDNRSNTALCMVSLVTTMVICSLIWRVARILRKNDSNLESSQTTMADVCG